MAANPAKDPAKDGRVLREAKKRESNEEDLGLNKISSPVKDLNFTMRKGVGGWARHQQDKSPFKDGEVTQQTLDSMPACTQVELVFSSPFSMVKVFWRAA
jgi:hypothetical protein